MPLQEAPSVELGNAPENASIGPSPSPSEISTTSSPEPQHVRPPPMFRILAMPPPDPEQPPGQEELERRLPGYRRIVIPRELTLIELLKQCSGAQTDDDVLRLREAKLKVIAERVGLRRLHILVPRLRSLTLDGSAISSLRDLGIGLVKLKVLSINRCGLTSLDGIFGLSALRELHAGGNKIRDLQPLAALQKLHTLDLSKNPITETSRLWTLGICSSLRKLCLMNTPLYDLESYRSHVASALPLLMYLDDRPLHLDTQYDELDTEVNAASSSSDSEEEELISPREPLLLEELDVQPSTSKECTQALQSGTQNTQAEWAKDKAVEKLERRRPATTEGIGSRPERTALPRRPHTAQERQNKLPQTVTRLEFMNTLLDEEWRCSGSALTSRAAVCGNLALALRGGHAAAAAAARHRAHFDITEVEKEMAEQTLADAVRALADEIPRAPRLEDWNKFREETGINIDIDFNARPVGADPTKAIERLEMIERETNERLEEEKKEEERKNANSTTARYDSTCFSTSAEDILSYDFDMWTRIEQMAPTTDVSGDVDIYDSNESRPRRNRHRHNTAAEN